MRIKYLLMILITGSLLIMQSCSKSSQEEMVLSGPSVSDEVISATVTEGKAYELPLADYGEVSISRQAENFLESTAGLDSKTGRMMYRYVPAVGFTGNDEVVLKGTQTVRSYSGGNMCSRPDEGYNKVVNTYITVKLRVTK